MSRLGSVHQSLQKLVDDGKMHETVRLSGSHQLKTDMPKGSWGRRIVKPLTPQEIDSTHSKQKQEAVDLIDGCTKKPLSAREITVGQAMLLIEPPKSDEEFLKYLGKDQFELDSDVGKTLFERYLEQKISRYSGVSVDVLSKVESLISEIPDSNKSARELADRWLTSQKINLLGNTPAYEKGFKEVIRTPAAQTGKPSFSNKEHFLRLQSFLPEYSKRLDMVASIPDSELETLKSKLEESGLPSSDPIYKSTLSRISTVSGQYPNDNVKAEAGEFQHYLVSLNKQIEEIEQSLAEDKQEFENFEIEKLSMSDEDLQEALWTGYIKLRIEGNENKYRTLIEWKEWMENKQDNV